MKKIFLLAAVAIASLTINAAEWDFGEFADFEGITEGSTVKEGLGFFALAEGKTPFAAEKAFGVIGAKAKTFDDQFKGTKNCKSSKAQRIVNQMVVQV